VHLLYDQTPLPIGFETSKQRPERYQAGAANGRDTLRDAVCLPVLPYGFLVVNTPSPYLVRGHLSTD